MPIRFISRDDLQPEQTWQLADWCLAHGATEFGVTMMSMQGSEEPFNDRFRESLKLYHLPEAPRPHMVTYVGEDAARPATLWRATEESVAGLRQFFHRGLFTYPTSEHQEGWLEDPTFYRDGEILMGIVSHEGEGYLELTTLETAQLAGLGIPTRDAGSWI